jgi:hypothetical protein
VLYRHGQSAVLPWDITKIAPYILIKALKIYSRFTFSPHYIFQENLFANILYLLSGNNEIIAALTAYVCGPI